MKFILPLALFAFLTFASNAQLSPAITSWLQ
ncbi:MAG: hypothetical protein ACI9LS_001865, partial [Flavobacteriales bacterium]